MNRNNLHGLLAALLAVGLVGRPPPRAAASPKLKRTPSDAAELMRAAEDKRHRRMAKRRGGQ